MSYIGKSPSIGSYSVLDDLTASATASYSLTLDSVAFVPESSQHLIVSLNGVIQKNGGTSPSFSVSGSTLTFSSALTSSDSIDFVLALGNVLDIGTPSDATVTNAKTNFVSTSSAAGLQIKGDGTTDGTLQLNCSQNSHGIKLKSPAHSAGASYTLTFPTTDGNNEEFLQTNGSGVLTWAAAGGGITEADQYRLTSDFTTADGYFASNLERNDTAFDKIGTGMTESSGAFSFPSTGIYLVELNVVARAVSQGDIRYAGGQIDVTTDGSGYTTRAEGYNGCNNHGSAYYFSSNIKTIVDVTNTSNVKVKFNAQASNSNVIFGGNTDKNECCFTFIRLGDT